MVDNQTKPSFDIWLRWADILARRLDIVLQTYRELERKDAAANVAAWLGALQRVVAGEVAHKLSGGTYAQLNRIGHDPAQDDDIHIRALVNVVGKALKELPKISKDMQAHFGVTWHGESSGRVAADLFKGPRGSVNEGIGSGDPADGHLPAVLAALLGQEAEGTERPVRKGVLATEEHQRWLETAKRWGDGNSKHLRRAGAIE